MSIAAIVPGQRYRLRIRAAEMPPCAGCGAVPGLTPEDMDSDGTEVVVLRAAVWVLCRCGIPSVSEGMWVLENPSVTMDGVSGNWAVPYTWLESEEEP